MRVKPTVDALLQRLTQLEERTAAAEERAASLEARLASGHQADTSQPGVGNGHTGPLTRGRFMKAAGMGLAGLAGAAILEKAATKDAYATFFADVVSAQAYIANGTTGTPTAPAGYGLNAPSSANFDRGVSGVGRNYGLYGDVAGGLGIGVFAGNGGRANMRLFYYAGITGNPSNATGQYGDVLFDQSDRVWVSAFLGGWNAVHMGGLGQSLFTAVSRQQYLLANSDGITWVDMDATNLAITFTTTYVCQAIITANADLWTTVAGHNQDIAAAITGGSYGTDKIVGWKESGSVAGAFSPNAAYLETIVSLDYNSAYTIKLKWKANNNATGATIVAGAGPYPAGTTTFSPTRLTVKLIPDRVGQVAPAAGVTKQVLQTGKRD
jgi:hypothetical protein